MVNHTLPKIQLPFISINIYTSKLNVLSTLIAKIFWFFSSFLTPKGNLTYKSFPKINFQQLDLNKKQYLMDLIRFLQKLILLRLNFRFIILREFRGDYLGTENLKNYLHFQLLYKFFFMVI